MSVAKNRLKTVLLYFFLLLVLLLPAASRSENADSSASRGSKRQSVPVLHSYHHGFTWSDNISRGIRSAFDERGSDAELIFEFMDTRRIHTEEYFTQLHDLFKVKYLNRKIDVIICADDHSLNFVLNRCGELRLSGRPEVERENADAMRHKMFTDDRVVQPVPGPPRAAVGVNNEGLSRVRAGRTVKPREKLDPVHGAVDDVLDTRR